MIRTALLTLAVLASLVPGRARAADDTLATVRARGQLVCGVGGRNPPFSSFDANGAVRGIDADFCRVVAAAVFGDATKVQFRPLTAATRFTALQTGEVDLLFNSSTWTMGRETVLGLEVAAVNYYGGMGILVHKKLGVKRAPELSGATICIAPGSTNELNLTEYFRQNGGSFHPVIIEDAAELQRTFASGRCDAWGQDAIGLAAVRQAAGGDASDYVLLPDAITMEPLGAFVRSSDPKWFAIVRWSILVTVAAEQAGITRENIGGIAVTASGGIAVTASGGIAVTASGGIAATASGDARALAGGNPAMSDALGLDARFAFNAIQQVGSYGQIWDANIGVLGVSRGLNRLWSAGGLMYSPPVR